MGRSTFREGDNLGKDFGCCAVLTNLPTHPEYYHLLFAAVCMLLLTLYHTFIPSTVTQDSQTLQAFSQL